MTANVEEPPGSDAWTSLSLQRITLAALVEPAARGQAQVLSLHNSLYRDATMNGTVVAVSLTQSHSFSKWPQSHIALRTGLGVEGDARAGHTVQHRSRVARDPSQPNLRQVHLLHAELLADLSSHLAAIRGWRHASRGARL